ncbi:hypothetical protein SD81_005055 [Tolypothrix campylonemoides VB511288]|nr:hypothetical protein SD81_005055 [Tolypothrix campylonemoides VB511288]
MPALQNPDFSKKSGFSPFVAFAPRVSLLVCLIARISGNRCYLRPAILTQTLRDRNSRYTSIARANAS